MGACLGNIRTQVDLVGIRKGIGGKIEVCAIELKTTSHTDKSHEASYDLACRRLSHVTVGGKCHLNTERLGHSLQASFGCHGLVNQWPEIRELGTPVPYVLVATTTKGLLYKSPLHPAAWYGGTVRAPAPRSKRGGQFDRIPPGKAGADLRLCLGRHGHKTIRPNSNVSCTTMISGRKCAVAIVGDSFPSPAVVSRLRQAAKGMRGIKAYCVVHRGAGGVGWKATLIV